MPPQIAVSVDSIGEQEALQQLVGDRAEIRVLDVSTPEAVAAATAGADAVVVALQPMSADRIAVFGERVRVIGRAGVGLDTVDLEAAKAAGVTVIHEPGYSTCEVADHAAAMLLASARQVVSADREMHARGGWAHVDHFPPILDVKAATLGVIGTGRIGSALIERMRIFVRDIVVYDPAPAQVPEGVTVVDSIEEVLSRADLVSLHLPLLPSTRGIIGRDQFAAMRKGAIFVNVARGGLVDEQALIDALESGHLGGAALDVFAVEPPPADSPLLRLQNVVITPHTAGHSEGAAARLAAWILDDVITHLEGGEPPHGRYAAGPFARSGA